MRKGILFLVITLMLLQGAVLGQNINDLHFNQNGKLAVVPSGFLNPRLEITIEDDHTVEDKLLTVLKNRMLYTDSLVRGMTTARETKLKDSLHWLRSQIHLATNQMTELDATCRKSIVKIMSDNYLDCPEASDLSIKNINTYLDAILFNGIKKKNKFDNDSLQNLKTDCYSELCRCEFLLHFIRTAIKINQDLYAIAQKKSILTKLFCNDSTYSSSIASVINKKSKSDTIQGPAILNDNVPHDLSIRNKYYLNDQLMNPESSANNRKEIYTIKESQNKFLIRKNYSLQELLINWHNQHYSILGSTAISKFESLYVENKDSIESMFKRYTDCNKTNSTYPVMSLYRRLNTFDKAFCPGNEIADWLKKWAWYGAGEFQLNYLPAVSLKRAEYYLKDKYKDKIADTLEAEHLSQQLNKISGIKDCLKCGILSLDTLIALQKKEKELKEKQIENFVWKKELEKYKKTNLQFAATTISLHEVRLPQCCGNNWIQFHNVDNEYLLCQQKMPVLTEETPVYFGFYNAKTTEDKDVKITEVKEDFKDKGFFVQDVSAALNEMAGAISPLLPAAGEINKFIGNLSGLNPVKSGAGDFTNLNLQNISTEKLDSFIRAVDFFTEQNTSINTLDDLQSAALLSGNTSFRWISALDRGSVMFLIQQAINQKYWRFQLLEDMIQKFRISPLPEKIETTESSEKMLYTFTQKALSWPAPYTNKYTISYKDKNVSQNRYSVGRLRRLTIGTGIFVNRESARQINVDSTGNRIAIKNSDNFAKFVIGFKIYPWKAFMADDGLIPKYPLRRINIFSGFEVTKPKDNLYFGLGYDIFPGLNVSAGYHVYKQTVYKVVNNQITSSSSGYKGSGFYYGITVDPEVAAGLIKVFFK